MRIIAATVALGTASLAASSRGWFCRVGLLRGSGSHRRVLVGGGQRTLGVRVVGRQAVRGVIGLRASSKEAVAEVADFGLKLGDLLLARHFALSGALVHSLVKVGLLSEGDGFEEVRTGLVESVTRRRK